MASKTNKPDKTPINARLSSEIVDRAKQEAQERGMTLTELLEHALHRHQNATGPDAAATKIAELEATIAEQERIVRKHTGKGTPKKRRITITLPVRDIQTIEYSARQVGMTRPEYLRSILTSPAPRRLLKPTTPALPE